MDKLKVLHVLPSLNLEKGGVAQGVINLSLCYAALGVTATVLTMDDPDVFLPNTEHLNVVALGKGSFGSFSYHPIMLSWLKKHIHEFDVAIVDGLWQYHGYAVYKALKNSDVPYYVYTHGMLDPWFKDTYPLKHVKKYLYWFVGQYPVLKHAKAVLFTCEDEKVLARESFRPYKVREKVVGYGADITEIAQTARPDDFYALYSELQEKRIFLFLSRIHEKKGCDLLIEAFAKVAKKSPDLHLVMAGPDQTDWQSDLEKLALHLDISNRITWTGMLKNEQKWGAIKAAEVFVLPSHQENFGIAVAEALAMGTPVLISNKVNIWREIQEMNAGLVADDTLDGTEQLLTKWLELDSDAREQMHDNAVQCFKEKFDIRQASINLINLIKQDLHY